MAVYFDGLSHITAPLGFASGAPFPLTMACWVQPAVDVSSIVVSVQDSAATGASQQNNSFVVWSASSSRTIARSRSTTDGSATLTVSPAFGLNSDWVFMAGIFRGAASRTAFSRGRTADNTTSITVPTTDTIGVGARVSGHSPFTGRLAHAAFWHGAELSVEDLTRLEAGRVSPLDVRRDSLIFYAPLTDGIYDEATGKPITFVGSPLLVPGGPLVAPTHQRQTARRLFVPPSGTNYTLAVDSASYTETLGAVNLTAARTITQDAASYTYTPAAIGTLVGYRVTQDTQSYTYTANAVGLSYSGAGTTYTIAVDAASYTYTANAVGLLAARQIAQDAASYTYTASDTGLTAGRLVTQDAVSFSTTAADVSTLAGRLLTQDTQSYTYTAAGVVLDRDAQLQAATAAYTVTAAGVGLAYSGEATTVATHYYFGLLAGAV